MKRWAQEPLLWFVALGAVIFAIDAALRVERAPDSRIVVSASQQTAVRAAFRAEHGRNPDEAELRARLESWIDEQVLYREARALGLDRRDSIVRRQLAQKMRFLIEDAAVLPEPSREELQDWLDRHAERYGEPATVSFQQVFLSRARRGALLSAAAAAASARLARAPEDFTGLGDPFPTTATVTAADAAALRRDFGPGFKDALDALPLQRWSGPVASPFGLHLVRITAREASRPAPLERVMDRVKIDLLQARREALHREAVQRLRRHYVIEFEPPAPERTG